MEHINKMIVSYHKTKIKIVETLRTEIRPLSFPTINSNIWIIKRSQMDINNMSVEHTIKKLGGDPKIEQITDKLISLVKAENFGAIALEINKLEDHNEMFGITLSDNEKTFLSNQLKKVL